MHLEGKWMWNKAYELRALTHDWRISNLADFTQPTESLDTSLGNVNMWESNQEPKLRDIYSLFYSFCMTFKPSFIQFTWYLHSPLFDIHDIYSLPHSIYLIFTLSLIRFTWYLQVPLYHLHDIYSLLYVIYMIFTGFFILFTWYLHPFLHTMEFFYFSSGTPGDDFFFSFIMSLR